MGSPAYNNLVGQWWRGFNDFTSTIKSAPKSKIISNYEKNKKTQQKPPPPPPGPVPANIDPSTMKFNLPPHLWSLPLNQTTLNSNFGTSTGNSVSNNTRRAVMWCYGDATTSTSPSSSTTTSSTSSGSSLFTGTLPSLTPWISNPSPANGVGSNIQGAPISPDFKWGFQFLWNPTDITTNVNRNVNFTPSTTDATANDYGVFTAMETVSFKIIIDRVNDFACAKGVLPDYEYLGSTLTTASYTNIINTYYNNTGYPSKPSNPERPIDQLDALLRLGTLADIEYIYKMINGDGGGGTLYTNALGRKTADIGFLSPTAIAVQFGPNPDSLSFVGYIDSLSIDHQFFTEDMIPLHSEITVGFVAYSRYSLTKN